MKIAVLSDIHGNIEALEAVLADVLLRGVDEIVNLGDICSGGLFPAETADRLMALDMPTIRGNHERQVLTRDVEKLGLSDRYALTTLREKHLAWFERLPETLWLRDDVLLVHGTPTSDVAYWLETVTEHGIRPATQDEIDSRTGATSASLMLCGHTHIPRVARLPNGQLIVNPGSVGLPAYEDDRPFPHAVETGSPHARYAIVDDSTGQWAAELINVEYDWETAAVVAANNGRDNWVRSLRTGRV